MTDLTFAQAIALASHFLPPHASLNVAGPYRTLYVDGRLYMALGWCEVFARAGVDLAPRTL